MIKPIRLVFLKKKMCKEHSDLLLITVFLLISVRRQISTPPALKHWISKCRVYSKSEHNLTVTKLKCI